MREQIQEWARQLKTETVVLYLAYQHPQTPLYAKIWTLLVVAYALSPIDLIPDFIPVLGYLDDVILLPMGIWVAIRLLPDEVLISSRQQAQRLDDLPHLAWMRYIIVGCWSMLVAIIGYMLWNTIR